MKFIKPQYSFPINVKIIKKNIEESKKNKKFRQKEKISKLFYDY